MIRLLTKFVLFVVGVVMVLDCTLPARIESVTVDRHSTWVTYDRTGGNNSDETTNYSLEVLGGSVSKCDVGYSLYSGLKDGDRIELSTTKLIKRCIRISKNGTVLQSGGWAKFALLISGFAMIAAAFGLITISNSDDSPGFRL